MIFRSWQPRQSVFEAIHRFQESKGGARLKPAQGWASSLRAEFHSRHQHRTHQECCLRSRCCRGSKEDFLVQLQWNFQKDWTNPAQQRQNRLGTNANQHQHLEHTVYEISIPSIVKKQHQVIPKAHRGSDLPRLRFSILRGSNQWEDQQNHRLKAGWLAPISLLIDARAILIVHEFCNTVPPWSGVCLPPGTLTDPLIHETRLGFVAAMTDC